MYTDWKQLLQDPNVDVVVETMGGTGDSLQLVRSALEQGKPVVTANKNLLAGHGDELFELPLHVQTEAELGFLEVGVSVVHAHPVWRKSACGERG